MGYRVRSALKSLVRDAMKQEILMDDARFLRRIRFEPLERRELMAADFFEATSNSSQSSWADAYAASQGDFAAPFAKNSGLVAEGEATAAPDLVAFAKALTTAGAKFYGADWCAFCTDQKNLFQEGKAYLPFVEVTNPDRTLNATGTAENITTYPTWKFANGQTVTGVQTLQQISTLSGVAIPTGINPTFIEVSNQTVRVGSPLHVPIDAYDPNRSRWRSTATVKWCFDFLLTKHHGLWTNSPVWSIRAFTTKSEITKLFSTASSMDL